MHPKMRLRKAIFSHTAALQLITRDGVCEEPAAVDRQLGRAVCDSAVPTGLREGVERLGRGNVGVLGGDVQSRGWERK